MNKPASTAGAVSDDDKLDILDRVISQVRGGQYPINPQVSQDPQTSQDLQMVTDHQVADSPEPSVVDQVLPGVALRATDTLNPAIPVGTNRERADATSSLETTFVEDGGGGGQVEIEKVPEMPVEVEGYLQHVEDHHDQLPQEVVVTGDDITLQPSHRPTTPVVVLPITEEAEKAAKGKNTSYSIRWLVEWGHKLIKKFAGKIIYRLK